MYALSNNGTIAGEGLTIGMHGLKLDAKAEAKDSAGQASPASMGGRAEAKKGSDAKDTGEELKLSDFEMLEVLGEGSSGMVQKVRHSPTGRFMALKVGGRKVLFGRILPETPSPPQVVPLEVAPQQRKQLLLELRTLHSVDCAQIVGFHGAFLQVLIRASPPNLRVNFQLTFAGRSNIHGA